MEKSRGNQPLDIFYEMARSCFCNLILDIFVKRRKINDKEGVVMERLKKISIMACLLLGMGAVSTSLVTPSVQAASVAMTKTIQVTGKGEMTIQPDVAYVTVGVTTQASTSQEAQSQNASMMAKIKAALQAKGISQEDLQTIQFSSYPRYEWEKDKNVLKGYQVEHLLRVTIRDLESIGQLLDAATSAGANQIQNIQFGTEKEMEYEGKVLEKAMDHALKKASVIAGASRSKIKGVVSVTELGTSLPPVVQPYMMEAKSAAPSTSISQGTLIIQAQLQVVYEIE